ncbi:hypothetical protein HMPREF3224_02448 [Anaerococcus hydrogenalis]|nr:hypothetical protein HMPREF3224_02448 [Anaerococcus hydrogenalis]
MLDFSLWCIYFNTDPPLFIVLYEIYFSLLKRIEKAPFLGLWRLP